MTLREWRGQKDESVERASLDSLAKARRHQGLDLVIELTRPMLMTMLRSSHIAMQPHLSEETVHPPLTTLDQPCVWWVQASFWRVRRAVFAAGI
jgi:hypothetical protein